MAEVLHQDGSFSVSPFRTVASMSLRASATVDSDEEPQLDATISRAPAERTAATADGNDRRPAISERMT